MAQEFEIVRDPDNKLLTLMVVDTTTGQQVPNTSSITMDAKLLYADGKQRQMFIQPLKFKDANTCVLYQAFFLMTPPEVVPQ